MNETWVKLKEWWVSLAIREKQAVAAGSSLLAIFIIYLGIWSPYLNHIAEMRKQIATDQKTLQWMEVADKAIQKVEGKSQGKGKAVAPVVLLSILQKRINSAGLEQYLKQLKQATNESIEAHFQKIEFDKLMKLLISVTKEEGVTVTQMLATTENAPGVINADILLKAG
jgi:general secretion pathway protein M